MKLWEIFRFEVAYQSRRGSTWFYFLVLLGITFLMARGVFLEEAKIGGYLLNAPFAVAQLTLIAFILGLLSLAALAGDAAARDVETRMHPILYSAPIGKATYLGGRLLATFTLGALMMSAIPAGMLGAALLPGEHGNLMGPIRPASYLSAYALLALPNALVAMALMFSAATFGRRSIVGYLGGVFVLFAAVVSWQLVAVNQGHWGLGKLADPLGLAVLGELSNIWTPVEKNTLLVGLQRSMLSNRLVWLGVAGGVLALTYFRFRFAHLAERTWWGRGGARGHHTPSALPVGSVIGRSHPIVVPQLRQAFGPATSALQALTIARESFRVIMTGWGGAGSAALAVFVVLIGPIWFSDYYDIPELPTTGKLVGILENPGDHGMWLVIPLLIVYYAGELVWREREAGLSQITDAAPVPVWVSFAGKFAGLALALVAMQALLMVAAMLVQARLGYYDFELGLYVRILFGIRLTDYLLFALLALVVHVVLDQKYVAHLITVMAYVVVAYGPQLGIEPGPLVYGSDPGWSYSDLRGLQPFLGPWLLFKLYWAAWALLLAVVAQLLWPRGAERDLRHRLRVAGRRFTRPTAATAAVAAALVLSLGGLIVYNISVHASHAPPESEAWRAEYERRYGRYAGIPQPRMTAANLHVEIYPERRAVEIRGTYYLLNKSRLPIDSVHVATALGGVETRSVGLDRPTRAELVDEELGHRIYVLEQPLRPGDSLRLEFEVRFDPCGFPSHGIDAFVTRHSTYLWHEWLPSLGYQRGREFREAGERRTHGLAPRPEIPPLDDSLALRDVAGQERILLEAVVGTDEGQIALAPGTLRATWAQDGRRYFHYATDAPIISNFAFFSAAYAVREGRWNDTGIQIFHHPRHTLNVDRMVSGVQASLDYLTRQLGPYPHRQIRFVEVPGNSKTLFAHPTNVSYQEGFALLKVNEDPRGVDLAFATVAHEVAHHWWGHHLAPAQVGGAALLTESLAWYSALEVVEAAHGREHFARLLAMMREDYLGPRSRAGKPLLRATDRVSNYRKGPLAMYALREYVGRERVDTALRRLLERHGSATPPLPTPLDLYRELQAVTPDSLRPLLSDLFEANTYWELETKAVELRPEAGGTYEVTLDVKARKVQVDSLGQETEVQMDDLIEIGVYAAAADGTRGDLQYLQKHRIHSGEQRIVVTVPREPVEAGIDPRLLLMDTKWWDNSRRLEGGRED